MKANYLHIFYKSKKHGITKKFKIKRLSPLLFKILKKVNFIKRYLTLFFKPKKNYKYLNLKKNLIEIEEIIYKHS